MRVPIPVVLAILLAVPLAGAETFSDPAGDVESAVLPTLVAEPLDILEFQVEDLGAEVYFGIVMDDLRPDLEKTDLGRVVYGIDFSIDGAHHHIDVRRYANIFSTTTWEVTHDANGVVRQPRFNIDEQAATVQIWVPRSWLTALDGGMLWGPTSVSELVVTSSLFRTRDTAASMTDRLPDSGTLAWQPTYGRYEANPALRVEIPEAVRGSNGGAMDLVFLPRITASTAGAYQIELLEIPSGWNAIYPSTIEVSSSDAWPILISTPSAHQHGRVEEAKFKITGQGQTAHFALGVSYSYPANPAGHHPTLFIHSASAADVSYGYMNTLEEDELDSGAPVAFRETVNPAARLYYARIPVKPNLDLGLSINGNGTPTASFSMQVRDAAGPYDVLASVYLEDDGQRVPLWEFPEISYLAFPMTVLEYNYTGTFVGNQVTIPAPSNGTLILEIQAGSLKRAMDSATAPLLEPGGRLALPLLEYREDLDAVFQRLGIQVMADEQEIRLAPGATGIIGVNVRNDRGTPQTLHPSLAGAAADWAGVDPAMLVVAQGGEGRVLITLRVPANAAESSSELRLRLVDSDGTLVGMRAFTVIVDAASTRMDEANATPPAQAASAFQALHASAVLLIAAAIVGGKRGHGPQL